MKIVYQSFDPSVNPGLFPSATVKELKTAGDDIALRLCGVIERKAKLGSSEFTGQTIPIGK